MTAEPQVNKNGGNIIINAAEPQEFFEPILFDNTAPLAKVAHLAEDNGYTGISLEKSMMIFGRIQYTPEQEAIRAQNGIVEHYLKAEKDADAAKGRHGDIRLSENYVNFAELEEAGYEVVKRLTDYDRRVYEKLADFYSKGYRIIPINELYKAMGHSGNPSNDDRAKLLASIRKMKTLLISYDNEEEITKLNYDYPHIKIEDENLLTCRIIEAEYRGQKTTAIQFAGFEPPLSSIGKQKGQFAYIKNSVYALPVSESDLNVKTHDYIMRRVIQIKSKYKKYLSRKKKDGENEPPTKIRYSTVYEALGITKKWERAAAKKVIIETLEQHKKEKSIIDFTEEKDGIALILKRKKVREITSKG